MEIAPLNRDIGVSGVRLDDTCAARRDGTQDTQHPPYLHSLLVLCRLRCSPPPGRGAAFRGAVHTRLQVLEQTVGVVFLKSTGGWGDTPRSASPRAQRQQPLLLISALPPRPLCTALPPTPTATVQGPPRRPQCPISVCPQDWVRSWGQSSFHCPSGSVSPPSACELLVGG